MIDVTDIPEAAEDTRVTLVGCDGDDEITMEELAEWSGGFHYEDPMRLETCAARVRERWKDRREKGIIMMIGMRIFGVKPLAFEPFGKRIHKR